ncbi:hypothetical protein COO60DRAFT_455921 [Scenedesmus sp. NREL 46B-D3]|nr:hypothetical protein COO60DRAFT_455921 [Scenedesmus sp. NREL 46B-D3]
MASLAVLIMLCLALLFMCWYAFRTSRSANLAHSASTSAVLVPHCHQPTCGAVHCPVCRGRHRNSRLGVGGLPCTVPCHGGEQRHRVGGRQGANSDRHSTGIWSTSGDGVTCHSCCPLLSSSWLCLRGEPDRV